MQFFLSHKLPDITIKVNFFDDFNKRIQYFIKPTAHIIETIHTRDMMS